MANMVETSPAPENKSEERMKYVKIGVECAVGGLVEMFMTAFTKNLLGSVGGSKLARLGVKAGGFLLGMYIGGKVSESVCDSIETTMNMLEEIKAAMETGGQK